MSLPATIDRLDRDLQQVSTVTETIFSYRIRNYNDYTIRVKLYNALVANVHTTTAPTLEIDVPAFTEQIDDPGTVFSTALCARCVTGSANDDLVSPANPPQVELQLTESGGGGSALYTATYAANHNLDASECVNGIIYVSSAATMTLPAVDSTMSVTIATVGATAVSVDPNGSEVLVLDGINLTGGHKATNLSTAGDLITLSYKSAGVWYAASNGWTDGG
jgi:hypothetical protein